ncbi:hypothetical protein PT974_09062 [Cladobotryum mycophilum]|uniref:Ubiquitin-conjugating enzyme E2C-binding protein n=1 Tax=Cladobotryum mycophilum TaxID=491253 RepID=A0ABR0SF71_9HYPO
MPLPQLRWLTKDVGFRCIIGGIPEKGAPDLAWRLPVPAAEIELTRFSAEDQAVPWSSLDIKAGSRIRCRKCDGTVVKDDVIKAWKDLPSENWAEMMEFWHCHKPHDEDHHHHDDEGLAKRGYGANSAITAQPSVGFVDLTSFMFSESDCSNLSFSQSISNPETTSDNSELALNGESTVKSLRVFCKTCSTEIGLFNVLASSVTLFKWQVTCETGMPSKAPSSSECLAATLIATISRSGSSKSVITPHGLTFLDEKQAASLRSLYLWVLNANVVYTSNTTQGRKTAIKVLYQNIDEEAGNKLVESMTSGVQEINFPAAAIETAREVIQESNALLPKPERLFQQWHVGLLERWA